MASPKRLEQRIDKLAEYGKTLEAGVNRVAFSEEDVQSPTVHFLDHEEVEREDWLEIIAGVASHAAP